jgi:ASC-1-like (ASCH) protein
VAKILKNEYFYEYTSISSILLVLEENRMTWVEISQLVIILIFIIVALGVALVVSSAKQKGCCSGKTGAAEKKKRGGQTTYTLSIQNPNKCPTFDHIKNGLKTVEGRKYSPTYQKYKEGDIIIFKNSETGETLRTQIVDLRPYETLEDYLLGEGIKEVLPGVQTMRDAIDLYNTWSSEAEREELRKKYKYGFVAIQIRLLDS